MTVIGIFDRAGITRVIYLLRNGSVQCEYCICEQNADYTTALRDL
jgi:hypothetical protein